jgi:hypothetical protein
MSNKPPFTQDYQHEFLREFFIRRQWLIHYHSDDLISKEELEKLKARLPLLINKTRNAYLKGFMNGYKLAR